jgi:Alginate export
MPLKPPRTAYVVLCSYLWIGGAFADQDAVEATAGAPSRPAIGFYRWQEDWSALADPALRTQPGDNLKYVPLSDDDPLRYLSLGVTLRERYEYNDSPRLGTASGGEIDYVIHRLEVHADAHVSDDLRVFVQIENALAPGLQNPGPADANKLDLRLAFADGGFDAGEGRVSWRVGRQEIAFDLQRFISIRDGPNVRQAYDAVWGAYEEGRWRWTGFASQPVQYRNATDFDDFSDRHLTYGGMRAERRGIGAGDVSMTFSEYRNDSARFPTASGEEHRRNVDVRYVGATHGVDWDLETMQQAGSIAGKSVAAWALGAIAGYTFEQAPWTPRVGVQCDAASGDRDLHDDRVGTFNPMFPNGYYETLSAYTGYANFINVKPSLALAPRANIKAFLAVGELWRQTTHDAVYTQPSIALAGTAGAPGRRTATYQELRVDWNVSRALALALEADHYDVARVVRNADGHDSTYVGAEVRWGW